MTRYERNKKRNIVRRTVIALFLFVVPLVAVVASIFFMDIYNGGSSAEASTDVLRSNNVAVFKYDCEIGNRTLYRLELENVQSFSEAESYVKSIKNKKLNGFILKDNGYKVIYGAFTNMDEASKVMDSIAKKAEGSISETKLPSFSLKYNEADSTFIELVQATDKLIWGIAESKSLLSHEIASKSKRDTVSVVDKIESGETKLEKYLGYAEKINASKEQKALRDSFVIMLQEVLTQKLDNEKDYYKIQVGLMNQIEAYRKFIEKLSN